jgi:hypothetical protein
VGTMRMSSLLIGRRVVIPREKFPRLFATDAK